MDDLNIESLLEDTEQRSFFGFKNTIARGIEKSQNSKLAISNLNFLLNAKGGKLSTSKISKVLAISEAVNNGGLGVQHYIDHYGFEGGKLTEETINRILKKIDEEEIMLIALAFEEVTMHQEIFVDQEVQILGLPFGITTIA